MVFPLHSVSGPGSKQLLNDGIEPISNRLKNQQAVTTPPAGRTGSGRGGGTVGQPRLLRIEVQIFVYGETVASTLTSDPAPVVQTKTGCEPVVLCYAERGSFWLTHHVADARGTTAPWDKTAPTGHLLLLERWWVTNLISIFISPIECLSCGCLPRPWDMNDEQCDLWKQIRISIKWPQTNP